MNRKTLIKQAEYLDIVLVLINKPYCFNSLTKIVFTAFCIHNETNPNKYSNRKKDFVNTFMENISLKLQTHKEDLSTIFEILDILKLQGYIKIDGDMIVNCKQCDVKTKNNLLDKCSLKAVNPIFEINKLDSKAMLEEVIRYV